MDKENVYIHNGVLFSHKEERNYVIFRKMDETGDHLVKQNKQTRKDKEHMFSLIHGIQIFFKKGMKVEGRTILGKRKGTSGGRETREENG
jgi:hypothetical protein